MTDWKKLGTTYKAPKAVRDYSLGWILSGIWGVVYDQYLSISQFLCGFEKWLCEIRTLVSSIAENTAGKDYESIVSTHEYMDSNGLCYERQIIRHYLNGEFSSEEIVWHYPDGSTSTDEPNTCLKPAKDTSIRFSQFC